MKRGTSARRKRLRSRRDGGTAAKSLRQPRWPVRSAHGSRCCHSSRAGWAFSATTAAPGARVPPAIPFAGFSRHLGSKPPSLPAAASFLNRNCRRRQKWRRFWTKIMATASGGVGFGAKLPSSPETASLLEQNRGRRQRGRQNWLFLTSGLWLTASRGGILEVFRKNLYMTQ